MLLMLLVYPKLRADYILQISEFLHDFVTIQITCCIVVLYKAAIYVFTVYVTLLYFFINPSSIGRP